MNNTEEVNNHIFVIIHARVTSSGPRARVSALFPRNYINKYININIKFKSITIQKKNLFKFSLF